MLGLAVATVRLRLPLAVAIRFPVGTAIATIVAEAIVALHNSAAGTGDGGGGQRGGQQQRHGRRCDGCKFSTALQELATIFTSGVEVGHQRHPAIVGQRK